MAKLTPRQAKFIVEYLIDLNATQAAIRAGYSAQGAAQTASALLTNPKIKDAIAIRRDKDDSSKLKSRNDILMALEAIMFTSPADYCECGADGIWWIHIGPEIPNNMKMPIKSITSKTFIQTIQGSETTNETTINKLEFYDKLKAIDLYSRLRGWLSKDFNVNIDARTQHVTLNMPDNGRRVNP